MINNYVDKLVIFNDTGIIEATNSRVYGSSRDYANVLNTPLLETEDELTIIPPYNVGITSSIVDGDTIFASVFPVYGETRSTILGYVYLEIGLDLFSDLLLPYPDAKNFFITDNQGVFLTPYPEFITPDTNLNSLVNGENLIQNQEFWIIMNELNQFNIRLYNSVPLPLIDDESTHLLYVTGILLCMSIFLGIILALLASRILAKPIQKLNHRLQLITLGISPMTQKLNVHVMKSVKSVIL